MNCLAVEKDVAFQFHIPHGPAETFCKLMHAYAPFSFRGCPRTAESGYNETYSVHLFVLWPLSLNMQPFCLCQLPPPPLSLITCSLCSVPRQRPSLFPLYPPSISTHDVYLRGYDDDVLRTSCVVCALPCI